MGETYIKPIPHFSRMKRFSAFVLSALLACLLMTATLPALAETVQTVEIHVDNGRKPYRNVAFYYVYGEHIEWWQGSAKFIFKPDTPEYKVIEEFMLALPSELGIEVLAGELHLVEGYVRAKYIFDGIIQFKDYMFIDNEGVVIVEWEYGTGLNVTIYSKAAVNKTASQVGGYGFADWKKRIIGYGKICDPLLGCRKQPIYDSTPTAKVPIGSEVLVVPVEGIVKMEMAKGPMKTVVEEKTETECRMVKHCEEVCPIPIDFQCCCPPPECVKICWFECEPVEKLVKVRKHVYEEPYPIYLGGGPNLGIADASKNIKAGMTFWDREPDYWLVYDGQGLAEVWKVDNWFNKVVLIWPVPHEVTVTRARL